MPTTRVVEDTIYHTNGDPWANATVKFERTDGSYSNEGLYPPDEVTPIVVTNSSGFFSARVWADEEGLQASRYRVTLPNKEVYRVSVPVGDTPITLTELILLDNTPVPVLPTVVEAHEAAPNPHPQYLTPAEANSVYLPFGHLLVADPHPQYLLSSEADLVYAPIASPALTGVPTAPTAAGGTSTLQLATTAYVRGEIDALIATSPATLDTLNELAAALGNDPNFAASTATLIGTKANLNGGNTLTGAQVLTSSAVGVVPLLVKGFVGQSADLQQWQTSTGTVLASISSSGRLGIGVTPLYPLHFQGQWLVGQDNGTDVTLKTWRLGITHYTNAEEPFGGLMLQSNATTNVLYIGGGTGLANAATSITFYTAADTITTTGTLRLQVNSAGTLFSNGFNANVPGIIVRAGAAQSTNVQEWQDSGGTVKGLVDSTASGMRLGSATASGTLSLGGQAPSLNYGIQIDRSLPATASNIYAINAEMRADTTSTGDVWGASLSGRANHTSGTIANVFGVDALARNTGAGTVTTLYGIRIQTAQNSGGGTISGPNYGLYIAAQTVGGQNYAIRTLGGVTQHETGAVGTIGLIVKGFASQTANLQEWQDSTGAILASIGPTGTITTNSGAGIRGIFVQDRQSTHPYIALEMTANSIGAVARSAANIPWVVQGAASQTADLQQWQQSTASVLAKVDTNGAFGAQALAIGTTTISSSARALIQTAGTTWVGLAIKGAASQTGNLQEWQDSTGAVLTSINANGVVLAPTYRVAASGWYESTLGVAGSTFTRTQVAGEANFRYVQTIDGGMQWGAGAGARDTFVSRPAANGGLLLTTTSAAAIPWTIKGAASQTGNLQEWQDSTGAVVAQVASTGIVWGMPVAGNYAFMGQTQTGAGTQTALIRLQSRASFGWDGTLNAIVVTDGGGAKDIILSTGGASRLVARFDGNIGIGTVNQFGSGVGVIGVANAGTIPSSNPVGGGALYSEAGAGKWRGSSGTVTTFGPADPHCPTCGRDFALEWKNDKFGELVLCMWCLTDGFTKGIISKKAA